MDAVIQQHRDTMAQIHTELTSLQRKVEELEEVKEENKRLKEELIQKMDSHISESERTLVSMKRMNKENKELKEKLDGVKDILQTETLASGIQNRFYEILNDDEESDED